MTFFADWMGAYPRHASGWPKEEDEHLQRLVGAYWTLQQIATEHGRTVGAIKERLIFLGLFERNEIENLDPEGPFHKRCLVKGCRNRKNPASTQDLCSKCLAALTSGSLDAGTGSYLEQIARARHLRATSEAWQRLR